MSATEAGAPTTARRLDVPVALLLVVICAIWGGSSAAIKIANEGISPVFQAGLRSIASALLMILWCGYRGIRLFRLDDTWPLGLVIGILFTLEFALLYAGLAMTDVSRAVLYIYTSPFVTALGAHFLVPSERLTPLKWLGLLLAFSAVVLVFSSGLTVPRREQIIGDLLCLGMGITWGTENVIIKVSRLGRVEPERVLFYNLAISSVLLTGGAVLIGEPGIFNPSARVLLAFAYAFVLVSFASYLIFIWMLRRYQAAGLASFVFLSPIFGVVIATLLLGESLTPTLLAALALNAMGIVLVNGPRRGPRQSGRT
ncbi:MAG: DMT family transporter [Hyphomicrobiaceae bacterium]